MKGVVNMKKILFCLIFLSTLVLGGCNDALENDLNLIERRLNEVQKACDLINSDIEALGSIAGNLGKYDFVTDVKIDRSGDYTVYVISMSNSAPIVIHEGKDAEGGPVIGIKLNSDGKYYWTITYPGEEAQYIRADDGNMVAATAASPQFRIKEGKWEVSYDEGRTWTDNYKGMPFGNATGESPKSFFDSVVDSVDYFIFRMKDSSEIVVPSWAAYEKIQEDVRIANENYKATQTLIETLKKKLFINGVMPISNGKDTVGYKLTMSDGNELSFYNGVPTNRPETGVSKDPENPSDTAYYWTIRQVGDTTFSWALFQGIKVRADAPFQIIPRIDLEERSGFYYWKITFDNGESWSFVKDTDGNDVRASIKESCVMDSISVAQEYVYIRQGGQEFRIERYRDFSVVGIPSHLEMTSGQDTAFTVSVEAEGISDYSEYEILPVASDGFVAKAGKEKEGKEWKISVSAPEDFRNEGTLSLIVSDGRGLMKTYSIQLVCTNTKEID